jgi:phosphatidylethanolamine/phosphatidyl-N-methylethanolamine N-methyltransferase
LNIEADRLRKRILKEFYEKSYEQYLFGKSLQAQGINYFEKSLERGSNLKLNLIRQLELGSGNGEHLPYVKEIPEKEYICLDLRTPRNSKYLKLSHPNLQKIVKFKKGNAEKLPFKSNYFEKVTATCLLHHVSDPLAVCIEARRVTQFEGEIVFILPTDPGILNQLVKRFISYRRMSKFSSHKPSLILALDHKNHISGLLEIVKFVFKNDDVRITFLPFRFNSWNFNLIARVSIVKKQ